MVLEVLINQLVAACVSGLCLPLAGVMIKAGEGIAEPARQALRRSGDRVQPLVRPAI